MKIKILLLLLFPLICQSQGEDVKKYRMEDKDEGMMGSTATTYDLSKEQLLELKNKSTHGNADATFRLYQYYSFTLNDIDKEMHYLEKASLQRHSKAQYNYAFFLSYKIPAYSKYYNLDKAIYWMEMAMQNGHIDAKHKLQELKSIKNIK
ncbi:sel1 repeat family protein [Enterobacter sp.]|uniref:sel1 repeat family protein n=1 Tax=Enterobacter sp. TaxID=42895 RepID=UPI0029822A4E|nr:sel1 repeat family protein [Enterobacter sp.]